MERMTVMEKKQMDGSTGCREVMDAGYAAGRDTGPENVRKEAKAKAKATRAKEEDMAKQKARARDRRQDAGHAEKIITKTNVRKEAGAKEARKEAAKDGKEMAEKGA